MLARLGYAAVILEGKPEGDDLYKILINKDGIQVIVDNSLKELDNYPVIKKLRKEYGEKVVYMSLGTAGERKLLAASIACTDSELRPTRHCGRGGVGAVMGAKRVKAIILDDAGMKMRPPKDLEKFRDANRKFVEGLRKHPVTGEGLPAYGTNILTNVLNEAGGYPTYNFKTGVFPGGSKISGEARPSWRSSGAGPPPTADTAAASSSAQGSTTTRTAITSPSSPSTRPSGPTAAPAASMTWTPSPGSTSWTTISASTPSEWWPPCAAAGTWRPCAEP